jgi:hypothetical protein
LTRDGAPLLGRSCWISGDKVKEGLYEGGYVDRNHLSNKEKVVEIKEMMFNIIAKISYVWIRSLNGQNFGANQNL